MSGYGNPVVSELRWSLGSKGFSGFPSSVEAPLGWVKEDGELHEEVSNFTILHPSKLYNITLTSTTYNQTYLGDYHTPLIKKYLNKSLLRYTIKNQVPTSKVLNLDKSLYYGNQAVHKKNIVFSWWHSPYGDLPLEFPQWLEGGGLPYYFLQPQVCRHGSSIQPNLEDEGFLGYKINTEPYQDSNLGNTVGFILPALYKNGKIVHIFGGITVVIAGVFIITSSEVLVVTVKNFSTASLWYVKIKSSLEQNEVTLISGNFYSSPELFEMRHPWRFSEEGLELSTLVGRRVTHPDTTFTIFPTKVTLTLEKILQNDQTFQWVLHDPQTTDYQLSLNGYSTLTSSSSGVTSSFTHIGYQVYEGNLQYPIALAYQENTLVIAYLDYSDYRHEITITGTTILSDNEEGPSHPGAPNNPGSGETSMNGFTQSNISLIFDTTVINLYSLTPSIISGEALAVTTGEWPSSGTYTINQSQSFEPTDTGRHLVFLNISNKIVIYYQNQILSQGTNLTFSGSSSEYGTGSGEEIKNYQTTYGYQLFLNNNTEISEIYTNNASKTTVYHDPSDINPPYFYAPEAPQDTALLFVNSYAIENGSITYIPRYTQASHLVSFAIDFRINASQLLNLLPPYFGEFTGEAFTFFPPFNGTPVEINSFLKRLTNLNETDTVIAQTIQVNRSIERFSPIGLI